MLYLLFINNNCQIARLCRLARNITPTVHPSQAGALASRRLAMLQYVTRQNPHVHPASNSFFQKPRGLDIVSTAAPGQPGISAMASALTATGE
jgi:hypothetical protein